MNNLKKNEEKTCACGGSLIKQEIMNNPGKFIYRCSNFNKNNCQNIYLKINSIFKKVN